jgi:FAD/FMN-containing dehydrogenase/Fe-S oxidoreductase/short-subunit dehydrogenase
MNIENAKWRTTVDAFHFSLIKGGRMTREYLKDHERFVVQELDADALARELTASVDGEVRFDRASRALYASDGSNYRFIPVGVVVPRTREAVEETMAVCRRYGAPIVSRGAGTALAGQTVNAAVVIDFSKYLNRILAIDPGAKTATVEPGTILDHLREKARREHHLTFGPDPATHNHCTLGGMIGNNSCGIHSVMAGRTVDNVHELEILTYDGLRMRVGPTSEEELEKIIAEGGRKGEIYRKMKEVRDRYGDLIRAHYPKIPRRVSGYNLDELLPENGFNVARALVGSEATCVTVLEATLRLVEQPQGTALLVLGYPDVYTAADHVPQIMTYGPIGLEGLDHLLIGYMKKKGLHPQDIQLLPDGEGWLLVEFGGRNQDEARNKAREAMEALKETDQPPSMKLFTDPEEEALVWEIRESGLGATANVPGMPLTWPGWEDAAVPPERAGDYLRDFRKLLHEFGYEASLYGHFGQGCIHCRIDFDLMTREGIDTYMQFIDRSADLVNSYGGSFSGEHGDGQARAALLPKMYGPELMEAFREFKAAWDPEWKMNPGKVVDAYRPDEHLRLGVSYDPWQPATHFRFPDDEGSFSRATLRCVGVGKCRRTKDAFMCPSFLATREEKDTTRGRAHLLFEMLRGDFLKDGWESEEVFESLELCLGCKGCKKECPVDVDLATYKAEFLSHYYRKKRRPLPAYAMGLIGITGRLGALLPRTANFLTQAPLLRNVAKFAGGVAQERNLPAFATRTFRDWFRDRPPANPEGEQVVLYPDLFNDCFFPQTLEAAVLNLEHWGFRVLLPSERPGAIRPLIHYGMLDQAKKELQRTIDLLRPFITDGVPVIFTEPSTVSVFRDELPGLFPTDRDGQRLTRLSTLFSEFVDERGLELPKLEGKVIFHGHCHQKAVLKVQAAKNVLARMGLEIEEPQKGCCGMAGSFGLERKHYAISMAIGEEGLLPAVRHASAATFIVADGFSCRTQIKEGTGREALHLAELVHQAFMQARREKEMTEKRKIVSLAEVRTRWQRGKQRLLAARERFKSTGTNDQGRQEVVVITGASAGVGRATAHAFARQGARIGLLARDRERLERTKEEVERLGGQALAIPTDVADPEQVEGAAEKVEKAFGPIDVWVNNAMTAVFAPFKEITPEEFKRVTEVTYLGQVYGTMSALKRMLPRDRGAVVQVGSALADRSIPLQSAYCGAKSGIRGFTDAIRTELLHDHSKVHLTMVQLPALNTPQFGWVRSKLARRVKPVPPVFQPEVAADAIVWAGHHRRREIYVGRSTVEAIWADKFIPSLLDKKFASSGYEMQQTEEAEDPNRPDNLFAPVPGDPGAHGAFDVQASEASPVLWLSENRRSVGLSLLAGSLLGAAALLAATNQQKKRSLPHRRHPMTGYHQHRVREERPARMGRIIRLAPGGR